MITKLPLQVSASFSAHVSTYVTSSTFYIAGNTRRTLFHPYAPPHSPRTRPIPLPPTETGKVADPSQNVVDLLCNLLYNKSTTNRSIYNGVWALRRQRLHANVPLVITVVVVVVLLSLSWTAVIKTSTTNKTPPHG